MTDSRIPELAKDIQNEKCEEPGFDSQSQVPVSTSVPVSSFPTSLRRKTSRDDSDEVNKEDNVTDKKQRKRSKAKRG